MLSFPFLVWVRMTFACIIPAMFWSEFELVPNIVITSLFYLNDRLLCLQESTILPYHPAV